MNKGERMPYKNNSRAFGMYSRPGIINPEKLTGTVSRTRQSSRLIRNTLPRFDENPKLSNSFAGEKTIKISPSTEVIPRIDTESMVKLPEKYRGFLPRHEQVNRMDLAFFEGLLDTYGLSEKRENLGEAAPEFGEDAFFSAATDIANYAVSLRNQTMPSWNISRDSSICVAITAFFQQTEIFHPTSKRLQDLCTLFFHHPKIKAGYMQIQGKKMAAALPGFMEDLAASQQPIDETQEGYFQRVTTLMGKTMLAASHMFTSEQIDTLGILIGYQERGFLYLPDSRRNMFSVIGNKTFTSFLQKVVADAIKNGQDIQQVLRREFLQSDGTGFTIMRTHIRDFGNRNILFTSSDTVAQAREKLAKDSYTRGACPAILKTEAVDGSGKKRPIVYEYASIIVQNMPAHLLQQAA